MKISHYIEKISIHSLYTERDSMRKISLWFWTIFQSTLSIQRETMSLEFSRLPDTVFQSTLSIQRETELNDLGVKALPISIHSLYTERDRNI